jgi:two-component system NtrC family sensor kinase
LFQVESDKEALCLVSVQPELLSETEGLPWEERVAAWALAKRQPALITDLAGDVGFSGLKPGAGPDYTDAIMATPLLVTGKPIGVLVVTRDYQEAYGLEDLRILQAVGSILSMALGKAQLYNEQVWLLRERERTQQQLVQTEKMVAMGRLVSAFMHEINNPLQAIQSFLGLAQEEVQGDKRQVELERYLAVAGAEVSRISTIIHNLRDFYSPASNEFLAIDINSIVASVLDLTGKQLEKESILIEWLQDPALPPVDANAGQLRQVFLNLVLNAVDAMSGGGTLRITTAPGLLGPGQSGPGVLIEFSDTGKGMSPEVQSRLFEPFFTTKTEGSGLGLSISYSIIRAHRGQILVTSHPGLGTTVTILLPLQQPERGQIS